MGVSEFLHDNFVIHVSGCLRLKARFVGILYSESTILLLYVCLDDCRTFRDLT